MNVQQRRQQQRRQQKSSHKLQFQSKHKPHFFSQQSGIVFVYITAE
jgi:hypothetical protein